MARSLALALAALAVSASFAATAGAAERFASPTGSGDCSSSDNACSIVTAINMAGPGDEVFLASGDYGSEALPLTTPLVAAQPNLSVHGVDGQPRPRIFGSTTAADKSVLDLSGTGTTARHIEVRHGVGNLRPVAFTFDGAEASDIVARNTSSQGRGCTLLGNSVLKNSVCEASGPSSPVAIFPYRQGVTAPLANTSTMRNVTAAAPAADGTGISAIGGNNPDDDQDLTVTNSIVIGGYVGVSAQGATGSARITITYSNFRFESAPNPGGTINDDQTNQRFMNPVFTPAGDYHQASTSPTIDAGADNALNGATDFDGDPRTLGVGGTDIGADELVPPPSAVTGDHGAITTSTAVVNGTVNANTVATSYRFDYGTSSAYGSSTPETSAGAGGAEVPVAETLAGLAAGTVYHYRAVATSAGGTTLGADRELTTAPAAGGLGGGVDPKPPGFVGPIDLQRSSFAAATRGDSALPAGRRRRRAPVGTRVTFTLDEAADVRFTVERATSGRRAGSRCVKRTRRNRRARKCTRWVRQRGNFTVAGALGQTRFRFTGRLRNRKLPVGRYRLVAVARDAAGDTSAPKRKGFKIVRR